MKFEIQVDKQKVNHKWYSEITVKMGEKLRDVWKIDALQHPPSDWKRLLEVMEEPDSETDFDIGNYENSHWNITTTGKNLEINYYISEVSRESPYDISSYTRSLTFKEAIPIVREIIKEIQDINNWIHNEKKKRLTKK